MHYTGTLQSVFSPFPTGQKPPCQPVLSEFEDSVNIKKFGI